MNKKYSSLWIVVFLSLALAQTQCVSKKDPIQTAQKEETIHESLQAKEVQNPTIELEDYLNMPLRIYEFSSFDQRPIHFYKLYRVDTRKSSSQEIHFYVVTYHANGKFEVTTETLNNDMLQYAMKNRVEVALNQQFDPQKNVSYDIENSRWQEDLLIVNASLTSGNQNFKRVLYFKPGVVTPIPGGFVQMETVERRPELIRVQCNLLTDDEKISEIDMLFQGALRQKALTTKDPKLIALMHHWSALLMKEKTGW